MSSIVACSECFCDQGLRFDAQQLGENDSSTVVCPNCGATTGNKLTSEILSTLAYRFFVWGSWHRTDFGGAPMIQFNDRRSTDVVFSTQVETDVQIFERVLGIGFFLYGPRLWMVGEVEPLKALRDPKSATTIIERILDEYPTFEICPEHIFYRIRKSPCQPTDQCEYDSPSISCIGKGRFNSENFPVMYGSPDLQICIHECRVTEEDDSYVATLVPTTPLHLLNLAVLLTDDEIPLNEFESLDMAIHMLFLAGSYSYDITRRISLAAYSAGFDGLVYPSYFSLLRIGSAPLVTSYGISHRRIPGFQEHEQLKTIPNIAIFGHPIKEGKVSVRCINRLILNRVEYEFHFGPVGFE